MGKMMAVVYDKQCKPEKMSVREVDKPEPTDNQLLIKICAVSINAADYRSLKMGMIPRKKIFGADVAGRVVAAGKNCGLFKVGDEVVGDLASYGFGGFAQYAVAPEKALVHKPSTLSFEDAAALPMSAVTALQALRGKKVLQKGQQVLIHGSAGGVGTFAIQLAKYYGAVVTAICSTKNVEQSRLLGADCVIDYSKEDFTTSDRRYDLILAVNGNRKLTEYKKALTDQGTYVMVGGSIAQIFNSLLLGWLLSFGTKKMCFLAAKPNQKNLELIVSLAECKKIKPVIDRIYSLENTAEAFRYVSEGHAMGKVVIKVGDSGLT